jgi:putative transposase
MLLQVKGMSERFACKVVGVHRSTFRRLPAHQTPNDPDVGTRAWLRAYARKNPCHGFRRAWAALRFDEGHLVNRKRVHRLWKQESLQVRAHHRRKRLGSSSVPAVTADAPKTVWALDFQFDSTVDGRAVKIASMVDEHTRESLLHLVERSITGEKLVAELARVFATRGVPKVLRCDNGPEMISTALQRFCANRIGITYIPPGTPWNNGYIESFNRRLRTECLNRNHWTSLLEARVVIGDFKTDHNLRHRHSALGYRTPAEYAAACTHTHHPVHPHPPSGGLRDRSKPTKQPGLYYRVVALSGTGQPRSARCGRSRRGRTGRSRPRRSVPPWRAGRIRVGRGVFRGPPRRLRHVRS